jgi:WD40 repeat protein
MKAPPVRRLSRVCLTMVQLCLVILLPSCSFSQGHLNNPPVQIVENEPTSIGNNTIAIWEVLLSSSGETVAATPVYETPLYYPASALPTIEQAWLSNCNNDNNEECSLPNVRLEKRIEYLTVSPDGKYLAWRESVAYCPDANCVGFQQMLIWDLSRKEGRILLEIPFHVSLGRQAITDLSWSSDSQYIAYIQTSRELGWNRVRVVDITTGHFYDIGEDVYLYNWAHNSDRIAYIGYGQYPFLRITSLSTNNDVVEFRDNWVDIKGLDWSPDDEQVAITIENSDSIWQLLKANISTRRLTEITGFPADVGPASIEWSPAGGGIAVAGLSKNVVYIIDPASGASINLNVSSKSDLELNHPSWSPDGQLIAVNSYHQGETASSGIAVLGAMDGTILSILEMDGVDENNWSWVIGGNYIVLKLQNQRVSCLSSSQHGVGLFEWRNDNIKPVTFITDTMEAISRCEEVIEEIARR